MAQKYSRSWVLVLFGLPFAGVGLGVLLLSVIPTLHDWSRMKSWELTDARLLHAALESHRGDDSTTYRVTARYEYYLGGQLYQGDRVAINSGSDNIGDFQQQLGARLEQALAQGWSISVWVNPEQPAESVIDRNLRWGLLGVKMIFVLVFGGVGIGVMLLGLWRSPALIPHAEANTKPWLAKPAWTSNKIYSNQKVSLWVGWIFAGIFNVISLPLAIILVPQELAKGNNMILIALIFPMASLWLLYWAIGITRDWRRFGNVYVVLDPFPGAIGGHVGASMELPVIVNVEQHFNVVLNCIYQYQSGSGKNRETNEDLIWQAEGLAQINPLAAGTKISFRFDIPPGLPASEPDSSEYHYWRLDIDNSVLGFSRNFEIPVYATGEKSRHIAQDAEDHPRMQSIHEALIDEISDLEQIPGGVRLYFPMMRNPSTSLAFVVVGAAFASGGGFMASVGDAPLLFLIAFGGLGVLLFLSGLYRLLNSLKVELDREGLRAQRFWLGISLSSTQSSRADILHLIIKESYSSQSDNGKHQAVYCIKAVLRSGKQITVADSLRGRATAVRMLETLGLLTGYPIENPVP